MRLYRGLKNRYRPDAVGEGPHGFCWTDFTDCPLTALDYAYGRQGVLLVLDVSEADEIRVWEELWFQGGGPRRLIVWGRFDRSLSAEIPAKELRSQIRTKGVVSQSREYKSGLLADYIDRRVAAKGVEAQ